LLLAALREVVNDHALTPHLTLALLLRVDAPDRIVKARVQVLLAPDALTGPAQAQPRKQ
jgi:stringent starvation protein B